MKVHAPYYERRFDNVLLGAIILAYAVCLYGGLFL